MKRLFKLKNVTNGKYHTTTESVVVHKGTKRKPKNTVGKVVHFDNKMEAKRVRDELGPDWRVTIAEDHRHFMG